MAGQSENPIGIKMEKITTILLTGLPGVGKTTLIRSICEELQKTLNIKCQGFYTEEVRDERGTRIGFDVVTLNGTRGILARDESSDRVQRRPRLGKYSLYLNEFETLALPQLQLKGDNAITIIDEIGKMELRSEKFESAVNALIDKTLLLATIPCKNADHLPVVARLKNSSKAKVFVITKTNRSHIRDEIMHSINEMFQI